MLIIKEVKQRLENSTKMRDDDALLMADIWREQLEQMGAKSMYDVLNAVASRMVHSPESIRRSRQKLQQENPNLRGKVYQLRMEKEEAERKARLAETPRQALRRLYEPVFQALWDMEFSNLHGTNPFRIIIDHFQVKNFIFVTIFLGFNCLIIVLL